MSIFNYTIVQISTNHVQTLALCTKNTTIFLHCILHKTALCSVSLGKRYSDINSLCNLRYVLRNAICALRHDKGIYIISRPNEMRLYRILQSKIYRACSLANISPYTKTIRQATMFVGLFVSLYESFPYIIFLSLRALKTIAAPTRVRMSSGSM